MRKKKKQNNEFRIFPPPYLHIYQNDTKSTQRRIKTQLILVNLYNLHHQINIHAVKFFQFPLILPLELI